MKTSIYWFRTRKEGNKHKTLITIDDPKKGWSTQCRCDKCATTFNRTFESVKFNFDLCDKCAMSNMNKTMFTDDIKQKISIGSSSWHAKPENKQIVSNIAKERYKDEEYSEKHKEACQERSDSEEYRLKLKDSIDPILISCRQRGISVEDFEDFITPETSRERSRFEGLGIRKELFKNVNYVCDICKDRGGKLNAHHLDGWNWCIEKRFDLDNLVCLCHACHSGFHKKYNNRDNTKEQYKEYKLLKTRI